MHSDDGTFSIVYFKSVDPAVKKVTREELSDFPWNEEQRKPCDQGCYMTKKEIDRISTYAAQHSNAIFMIYHVYQGNCCMSYHTFSGETHTVSDEVNLEFHQVATKRWYVRVKPTDREDWKFTPPKGFLHLNPDDDLDNDDDE